MSSLDAAIKKPRQAYPVVEEVLKDHFKDRPIRGIEIGVLGGSWTSYMLHRVPNIIQLVCIEPWRHFERGHLEQNMPQESHDQNYKEFLAKIEPFKEKVITCKTTSDLAVPMIRQMIEGSGQCFDFVYIDGNHAEDQVDRDIRNYYDFVTDGGIVMGHDYGLADGVSKCVRKYFSTNDESEIADYFVGDDFVWWHFKHPGSINLGLL